MTMTDPLEQVLRLVAEGRLTAEEAEPILDALEAGRQGSAAAVEAAQALAEAGTAARFARIEVREAGRKAVDLRIPLSLGRLAMSSIPGLAGAHAAQLNEAIAQGVRGAILDTSDEDGDGVRIVLE
jgi:urease accessory protein UreF